jgi:hypothetical protein
MREPDVLSLFAKQYELWTGLIKKVIDMREVDWMNTEKGDFTQNLRVNTQQNT